MSVNCRLKGFVTRLDLIHHHRSGTDSRSCRSPGETVILWVGVKAGRSPEEVDR